MDGAARRRVSDSTVRDLSFKLFVHSFLLIPILLNAAVSSALPELSTTRGERQVFKSPMGLLWWSSG